MVFNGRGNAGLAGVYTDCFGGPQKVIGQKDMIDDKAFYGVSAPKESFDRGQIVINVAFDDSSKTLYLVRPAGAAGKSENVMVPAIGEPGIFY